MNTNEDRIHPNSKSNKKHVRLKDNFLLCKVSMTLYVMCIQHKTFIFTNYSSIFIALLFSTSKKIRKPVGNFPLATFSIKTRSIEGCNSIPKIDCIILTCHPHFVRLVPNLILENTVHLKLK